MEDRAAARLVIWGNGFFMLMMGACVAIQPSWTAVQRGLSYYGNDLRTLAPYTAGFAVAIGLSAEGLRRHAQTAAGGRRMRSAVRALLALMALIPLTPYSVDEIFDFLHIGVTVLLFAAGVVLGGLLALVYLRDLPARLLFAAQLATGGAVLAAQAGYHSYMIPCELLFQLLVVALIVRALRRHGRRTRRAIRRGRSPNGARRPSSSRSSASSARA